MRCRWSAWLLGSVLILTGCTEVDRQGNRQQAGADWQAALHGRQALVYRKRCVEAIERRRARLAHPLGALPEALNGQTCQHPALREFALEEAQTAQVRGSVIRLNPDRLSGYTLAVRGRDGELYTYVDRGVAAATAEQAGTFGPVRGADLLPPDSDEAGTAQPRVTEGEE